MCSLGTRTVLARLAALTRAFDVCDPMLELCACRETNEGPQLFLTNDGWEVATDLVEHLMAARTEIGTDPDAADLHGMLTVCAAALHGLRWDAGPVPNGEVAAAVAGMLRLAYDRALLEGARGV